MSDIPKTTLLAGTVGIITGAGGGIGASAVECFAAAGARAIYAADLRAPEIDLSGKGLESEVVGVACDITKEEQVEALVRRVIKEHGRLDWFFANAGIVDFECLNTTTTTGLHRRLDVNVVGAFNSIQWAARGMMNTSEDKPAPGGSIIVTTSIAATFGGMGSPAYTVSKHAAVGLVRAAATNLKMANTNIRVNGVGRVWEPPGPTDTNIHIPALATASEQARTGMAEHTAKFAHLPPEMAALAATATAPPSYISQTAVFLASDMAAGVNGENIIVDKGLRQMPDLMSGIVFKPSFEPIETE